LDGGPLCFRCHGGWNFSDESPSASVHSPAEFHNTGLYNLAGAFSYPQASLGLCEHTRQPADVGKFKAPTLRNIPLTAPYMHDGTIAEGALAGVGHDNPLKDKPIRGFYMTPQNRTDLVAFLESLTDEDLIHDPKFSDPW
jgi:cytochrome c peroxidase